MDGFEIETHGGMPFLVIIDSVLRNFNSVTILIQLNGLIILAYQQSKDSHFKL